MTHKITDASVHRAANAALCGTYCACVWLVVVYCLKPQILWSSSWLFSAILPPVGTIVEACVVAALCTVLVLDALINSLNPAKLAMIAFGGIVEARVLADHPCFPMEIMLLLIVAYPSHLSRRRAVATMATALGAISILTVSLHVLGVIPEEVRYEHGVLRHSLGFTLGIEAGRNLSIAVLALMYCLQDKWKPIYPALVFCAASVILTATDSRGAFLCVILGLVGVVALRALERFAQMLPSLRELSTRIARAAIYAFPAFTIFSLIAALTYEYASSTSIAQITNVLLTSRPYLWAKGIDEAGLSALGSKSLPLSSMDNTYLYMCIRFGLLFVVALAFIHVISSRRMCGQALAGDSSAAWDLLFITTLLVFGMTTPYLRNVANNFGILLLGYWLNHSAQPLGKKDRNGSASERMAQKRAMHLKREDNQQAAKADTLTIARPKNKV